MLASILSSDAAWLMADLPKVTATLYKANNTIGSDGGVVKGWTSLGSASISMVKAQALPVDAAGSDSQTQTWSCIIPLTTNLDVGGKVVVSSVDYEIVDMAYPSCGVYVVATLARYSGG